MPGYPTSAILGPGPTNKCVDVNTNTPNNGNAIQLWDCNGVQGQQWVARTDGSLYNPQSGRCLDDPQGNTANGTQLRIYDCNGLWTQVWNVSL